MKILSSTASGKILLIPEELRSHPARQFKAESPFRGEKEAFYSMGAARHWLDMIETFIKARANRLGQGV